MKKIYIFILVLFSISVQAQKYYYNGSEKVQLYQSEKSFILFDESTDTILKGFEKAELYKVKNFTILKNKMSNSSMKKTFEKKSGKISPAYTIEKNGNFELYPTKTVRVKLLPNKSKKDISKLLDENSIFQIKEEYGIIRIKVYNINNVFDTANKIYESGIAEFSLPDFYIEKEVNQVSDPLFPLQYQMNNTGQVVDGIAGVNDIDSNALEAWDINLGDNITVAIVDQGLEAHEDIGNRLIGGHTPLNNGNGQPIANDDTHGMNCAGVLAASDNNIGVRGVAPNVNLLSVNIFAGGETAGDIADGITWAVNNGADVISNSWSLSNVPCGFANADIDNAIQDAVTRGRNQRGCVVVFSSGNDNTFQGGCVDYPATNPNVISVGAIDNRGNLYGYSRRGPELDLVAPSGLRFFVLGETTVGVRTLDRMGTAGNFAGNYRDDFDGTSASCPVVSGVAALVLSINPNLTQQEIRDILTLTATDMGAGGFDNNFGFGRVNAFAAVQMASQINISELTGNYTVCNNSSETYNLTNGGNSVSWEVTSNLQILSSSSTQITVLPISSTINGTELIKAILPYQTIEKEVWVGTANFYLEKDGTADNNSDQFCKSNLYSFDNLLSIYAEGGLITEYEVEKLTDNFDFIQNFSSIAVKPHTVGSLALGVRVKNDCEWSNWKYYSYEIIDCGRDGGIIGFSVSPNPIEDNTLTVIELEPLNTEKINLKKGEDILLELYNLNSIKIKSMKIKRNNNTKYQLDVSKFNNGIYFVKILSGNYNETHQIIIDKK